MLTAFVLLVMTDDSNSDEISYYFVLTVRLLRCVLTMNFRCPCPMRYRVSLRDQKICLTCVAERDRGGGLAALSLLSSQLRLGLSKAGLLFVTIVGVMW